MESSSGECSACSGGLPFSSVANVLKDSDLRGKSVSKCKWHSSEDLSFYCLTCKQTICRNCIVDRKHSQAPCDYRRIEEAARVCREDLKSKAQGLTCSSAKVRATSQRLEKLEPHRIEEETEAKISECYDNLFRALSTKKEKTLQLLREGSKARLQEIEAWQRETQSILSQIQHVQESVELLNDEQILAHSDSLLSEITDIDLKIPVIATQDAAMHCDLNTVSVDSVMSKLESDLEMYCNVDSKQSTVVFDEKVSVNTPAHVYITLCDSTGLPSSVNQQVSVQITSSSNVGDSVKARVTPISSSRYVACYTPTLFTRGRCQLSVEVNGEKIGIDPLSVDVECPPHRLHRQMHIIHDVNERGCLKLVGRRVFCFTRDSSNHGLAKYIEYGNTTTAYTLATPPRLDRWAPDEIAIGSESNSLYVCDPYNHMIHRFTLDFGSYINSTGRKGSEVGQFDRPNGLCVASDGNIYICDSENHRIQVFDKSLTFVRAFGSLGTCSGEFLWPSNVAVASDGKVYVTELHNHRIQCLTSRGDHIRFIGGQGNGERELSRPNILHIHDAYLFVSDDRGVVVFSPSGQFITRFATELARCERYPIEGLTVSSDGFVYVYDRQNNRVILY